MTQDTISSDNKMTKRRISPILHRIVNLIFEDLMFSKFVRDMNYHEKLRLIYLIMTHHTDPHKSLPYFIVVSTLEGDRQRLARHLCHIGVLSQKVHISKGMLYNDMLRAIMNEIYEME